MKPGPNSAADWLNLFVAATATGLLAGFLFYLAHPAWPAGSGVELSVSDVAKRIYWVWLEHLGNYWLVAGSAVIFLLQFFIPADRDQPLFCRGLLVDAGYLAMMVPFIALVAPLYWDYLRFLVVDGAGFSPGILMDGVPGWIGILLGYLAVDFLGWLHHLVRHKVPFFWRFHRVHHSQTEMNPLTNYRLHPLDWLNAQTIKLVPALILVDSFGLVLAYLAFHSLHDRLNHSNIRGTFGPLRYVFVTPQSHRIHHSSQAEHFDSNFGVSLSIWDRLFGTQHPDAVSYPETGFPQQSKATAEAGPAVPAPVGLLKRITYPIAQYDR